jgi:hypothetical protein
MPVTMYTLNDQGLPLYNIVEEMPPGDICNINVKPNDFVLFYYGWNDVQKNISKYSGGNYESMIDSLLSKYLNLINAYKNGTIFSIRPIIACIYPIPLNTNDSIVGSEEDRIAYTLYMNESLKSKCAEYNIPFFDIYDLINEAGCIHSKFIDTDMTHLDRSNKELRKTIEDKLLEICNNYGLPKYIN